MLSSLLTAQTGDITGYVTEEGSKLPLVGANIIIEEAGNGTTTDLNGYFRIKGIKPGNYTLKVSYIGYKTVNKTDIIVKSGSASQVEIFLRPVSVEFTDVVVKGSYFEEDNIEPVSVTGLSQEEIRRSPGSAGDISRVMLVLPSVAKINDTRNSLIVRGGSPVENAFFIDNIEVPNINHFPMQGSSDGPIGLINLELVRDVEFYSGGFNADYGNRLSSVMNISFREGNSDKFRGQLDFSMQGIGAVIEGPLPGERNSWVLSYRRSYFDLLFNVTDMKNPVPSYSDIHFKSVMHLSRNLKLKIIDIFASDRSDVDRPDALEFKMNNYGEFRSNVNTFGITAEYIHGADLFSSLSLSHTLTGYDVKLNLTTNAQGFIHAKTDENTFNIRNINHLRLGSGSNIDFGADARIPVNSYDQTYFSITDREGKMSPLVVIKNNFSTFGAGIFAKASFNTAEKIMINPGLRLDYYNLNKEVNLAPRLSLKYSIDELSGISASAGLYYQNLPLILQKQKPEFENLKNPQAWQFVIGGERLLSEDTKLTVEAYYKLYSRLPMDKANPELSLFDMPIDNGSFSGYTDIVSDGEAYSAGIEISVQKKLAKDIYGFAGLSVSDAKYRGLSGKTYDRRFNSIIGFSAEGGYKPNDEWDLSLRWSYSGGAPYTPFDELKSVQARSGIYDMSRINGERLPAYHSVNLRVDKRFNFSNTNLIIYLSVWNAYGRINIAGYYWDEVGNKMASEDMWSTLPVLGVEYEF